MELKVEISVGELLDKITILEIKSERVADEAKLANIRTELETLRHTWRDSPAGALDLGDLQARLKQVNELLWDIEDGIRNLEAAGSFGDEFVRLARSVYHRNDERAALKREVNRRAGSRLVEEKSYTEYRGKGKDPS
ncbi:hypothetical protein CO151_04305 [bacterium CG_4_9_14_3_um_filter_65_15]|nr:MAG: hypothetical protein CO151_04305 [bacterium CG_4_9_14_3_um_filter_65_15]